MHRRNAGVGVLVLCSLLLTSCGGDDDYAASEAGASQVAPMLLGGAAAPTGYSWHGVAELLGDEGSDSAGDLGQQIDAAMAGVTTEPASCSALVPTADSIIAELYDHRDAAGAVEFLPTDPTDPAVIDALVSVADSGDTVDIATGKISAGKCGDFTRTRSDGTVTRFRASAQKASIDTTDDTTVITVLSDSVTPGEELIATIAGTVRGVHFRIAASGVTDLDVLTDLAQKQVAAVIGYMEGQD